MAEVMNEKNEFKGIFEKSVKEPDRKRLAIAIVELVAIAGVENVKPILVRVLNDSISEIDMRDNNIREEYKDLREGKFGVKLSGKQAREFLAEKHFTSIKNIERILYGSKNK